MLKVSQSKSKRDRLEEARVRLHKIFGAVPGSAPARKLSGEERLAKAWELALEIGGFARKYLSHYLVDQETGEAIAPAQFHLELYQLLLVEMRVAVAAPREHAKSTVVSFIFPLYCICYKLRWFILLISDTESQAILQLGGIKEELETNDILRADFGDLIDDRKWGERDIVTSTGRRVSARGAGQSLRGLRHRWRRPDLVICDDLENEEATDSPERREKLERWFRGTVLNLGKKCQIVVIGTILHYDSLLSKLLSAEHFELFVKRTFIAVDDDWSPASVLWPAKWPLESLHAKEADIGSIMFDQEFRNRPINAATQVFKEDWVKQHAYTMAEIRGLKLITISAHDPAISQKQKADDFGSVTVGVDPKGFILVLRAEGKKIPWTEQVDYIFGCAELEKPSAVGIETVAYQKALEQEVIRRGREEHKYLPVVAIEASQIDKFRRITSISPLVQNGTIRFRLDGTQDKLLKQLYFLGKTKDDIADALEMCVQLARKMGFKGVMICSDDDLPVREKRKPYISEAARPENEGGYTIKCGQCSLVQSAFWYRAGVLQPIFDCKNCGLPLTPKKLPYEEVAQHRGGRMFGDMR